MSIQYRHWPAARVAFAAAFMTCTTSAWCQDAVTDDAVLGAEDVTDVGKIGQLQDNIRRARRRGALYQAIADFYADYTKRKTRWQDETGVAYSMDVSLLQQWGVPNGGSPALQIYATPSVDWTIFKNKEWGTGSLQLAYYAIAHYPTTQNATDIQSNLGLITPINDYPGKALNFAQLSYTQSNPGNTWLFTAGQYPFSNFDGNAYLGNQQQNFNNYLFAQNGTQTYLVAGLGAYVQFNATTTLQFAAGFQGANNVPGQTISGRNFNRDCCAWFGYAQWTPKFRGLGSAQYSFSYFDTPGIPAQPATRGWSVNAVQNLDDSWAVFGRANGASGFVTPIKTSYALGVAMNNPLKRASSDQIALAVGLGNAASPPTNPAGARNEKVVELYWTWTFFGGFLLTPSVQMIFDPALNPTNRNVSVLSLRGTLSF